VNGQTNYQEIWMRLNGLLDTKYYDQNAHQTESLETTTIEIWPLWKDHSAWWGL